MQFASDASVAEQVVVLEKSAAPVPVIEIEIPVSVAAPGFVSVIATGEEDVPDIRFPKLIDVGLNDTAAAAVVPVALILISCGVLPVLSV